VGHRLRTSIPGATAASATGAIVKKNSSPIIAAALDLAAVTGGAGAAGKPYDSSGSSQSTSSPGYVSSPPAHSPYAQYATQSSFSAGTGRGSDYAGTLAPPRTTDTKPVSGYTAGSSSLRNEWGK
jgi:hypothetical protein